jgi:LysM repeat protein
MTDRQNARWIVICSVILSAALFLLPASVIQAQADGDTYILYYEDEYPNRLDFTLLSRNICLEAVLRLNPDLDINDIAYGERLRIPVNEPCYQYDQSSYGWWNFSDGYPARLKYYENGQWLHEPYYSDEIVYIRAESVEDIASRYNICVDELLAENVLLQDFTAYRAYALISLDIFIPKDAPPCDPNWTEPTEPVTTTAIEMPANEIAPLFFVNQYNTCVEDIPRLIWGGYFYVHQPQNPIVTIDIPNDVLPCYNQQGQRLSYYDEMGHRLEEPVYSDLAVYVASPGETMSGIADQMGVCVIDLLRVNNFPDMPLKVAIELFIPPSRPCPDDIEADLVDGEIDYLTHTSLQANICPEDLLPLNPHFSESTGILNPGNRLFSWNSQNIERWIITPKDAEPCYWQYHPSEGDSIFDIERALNICYQEFRREQYISFLTIIPHDRVTLYIPHDVQPCYNEDGQRLQYSITFEHNLKEQLQTPEMQYADMPVYIFRLGDTAYSISLLHNVCVPDLLAANPMLVSRMPTGHPVFIPQTRPCYDEATGMPLIYEDEDGNPLPQPLVSDQLIYYGSQPFGIVSAYYNVCMNRIADANRAKLDQESSYLGWIIPTDRPPCYDAYGSPIHYVCYTQPVDFSVDYSQADPPMSFDIDGTYCYDLAASETIVWNQNKPYQIIQYDDTMLRSRAFTAWCFGVLLEEINAINDDPNILSILPFQYRALPLPTRECYIQNPGVLDGYDLHPVVSGDTLVSIARQYDKPYQWIARANDLDEQNTIWAGQMLIIPAGPTLNHLYLFIGGVISLVTLVIGMRIVKHPRKSASVTGYDSTSE